MLGSAAFACSSSAGPSGTPANEDDRRKEELPTVPAPDGGAPIEKTPAKDGCLLEAEARCAREETCRENAFTLEYGKKEVCLDRKTAACEGRIGIPGSTFGKTNAAACAKAVPSLACDDLLIGLVPEACRPPPGILPLDGGCADDAQCDSGVCLFEDATVCGKCSERRPAGSLQRCSKSAQCPDGEACRSGSTDPAVMQNGVCRPIARAAESCGNAYCEAGSVCYGGKCTPLNGLGETCSPFDGACDPVKGLTCDLGSATCVAPARKFALDKPCDSTGLCEIGTTCKLYSGFGNICRPIPKEGEVCTNVCAAPARCAGYGSARKCVVETADMCSK